LKAVTREGSSPYDFSPCDFIAAVTRNERSDGGGGAVEPIRWQEMALRRLSLAEEAEK
jgi:hypothetical protein